MTYVPDNLLQGILSTEGIEEKEFPDLEADASKAYRFYCWEYLLRK